MDVSEPDRRGSLPDRSTSSRLDARTSLGFTPTAYSKPFSSHAPASPTFMQLLHPEDARVASDVVQRSDIVWIVADAGGDLPVILASANCLLALENCVGQPLLSVILPGVPVAALQQTKAGLLAQQANIQEGPANAWTASGELVKVKLTLRPLRNPEGRTVFALATQELLAASPRAPLASQAGTNNGDDAPAQRVLAQPQQHERPYARPRGLTVDVCAPRAPQSPVRSSANSSSAAAEPPTAAAVPAPQALEAAGLGNRTATTTSHATATSIAATLPWSREAVGDISGGIKVAGRGRGASARNAPAEVGPAAAAAHGQRQYASGAVSAPAAGRQQSQQQRRSTSNSSSASNNRGGNGVFGGNDARYGIGGFVATPTHIGLHLSNPNSPDNLNSHAAKHNRSQHHKHLGAVLLPTAAAATAVAATTIRADSVTAATSPAAPLPASAGGAAARQPADSAAAATVTPVSLTVLPSAPSANTPSASTAAESASNAALPRPMYRTSSTLMLPNHGASDNGIAAGHHRHSRGPGTGAAASGTAPSLDCSTHNTAIVRSTGYAGAPTYSNHSMDVEMTISPPASAVASHLVHHEKAAEGAFTNTRRDTTSDHDVANCPLSSAASIASTCNSNSPVPARGSSACSTLTVAADGTSTTTAPTSSSVSSSSSLSSSPTPSTSTSASSSTAASRDGHKDTCTDASTLPSSSPLSTYGRNDAAAPAAPASASASASAGTAGTATAGAAAPTTLKPVTTIAAAAVDGDDIDDISAGGGIDIDVDGGLTPSLSIMVLDTLQALQQKQQQMQHLQRQHGDTTSPVFAHAPGATASTTSSDTAAMVASMSVADSYGILLPAPATRPRTARGQNVGASMLPSHTGAGAASAAAASPSPSSSTSAASPPTPVVTLWASDLQRIEAAAAAASRATGVSADVIARELTAQAVHVWPAPNRTPPQQQSSTSPASMPPPTARNWPQSPGLQRLGGQLGLMLSTAAASSSPASAAAASASAARALLPMLAWPSGSTTTTAAPDAGSAPRPRAVSEGCDSPLYSRMRMAAAFYEQQQNQQQHYGGGYTSASAGLASAAASSSLQSYASAAAATMNGATPSSRFDSGISASAIASSSGYHLQHSIRNGKRARDIAAPAGVHDDALAQMRQMHQVLATPPFHAQKRITANATSSSTPATTAASAAAASTASTAPRSHPWPAPSTSALQVMAMISSAPRLRSDLPQPGLEPESRSSVELHHQQQQPAPAAAASSPAAAAATAATSGNAATTSTTTTPSDRSLQSTALFIAARIAGRAAGEAARQRMLEAASRSAPPSPPKILSSGNSSRGTYNSAVQQQAQVLAQHNAKQQLQQQQLLLQPSSATSEHSAVTHFPSSYGHSQPPVPSSSAIEQQSLSRSALIGASAAPTSSQQQDTRNQAAHIMPQRLLRDTSHITMSPVCTPSLDANVTSGTANNSSNYTSMSPCNNVQGQTFNIGRTDSRIPSTNEISNNINSGGSTASVEVHISPAVSQILPDSCDSPLDESGICEVPITSASPLRPFSTAGGAVEGIRLLPSASPSSAGSLQKTRILGSSLPPDRLAWHLQQQQHSQDRPLNRPRNLSLDLPLLPSLTMPCSSSFSTTSQGFVSTSSTNRTIVVSGPLNTGSGASSAIEIRGAPSAFHAYNCHAGHNLLFQGQNTNAMLLRGGGVGAGMSFSGTDISILIADRRHDNDQLHGLMADSPSLQLLDERHRHHFPAPPLLVIPSSESIGPEMSPLSSSANADVNGAVGSDGAGHSGDHPVIAAAATAPPAHTHAALAPSAGSIRILTHTAQGYAPGHDRHHHARLAPPQDQALQSPTCSVATVGTAERAPSSSGGSGGSGAAAPLSKLSCVTASSVPAPAAPPSSSTSVSSGAHSSHRETVTIGPDATARPQSSTHSLPASSPMSMSTGSAAATPLGAGSRSGPVFEIGYRDFGARISLAHVLRGKAMNDSSSSINSGSYQQPHVLRCSSSLAFTSAIAAAAAAPSSSSSSTPAAVASHQHSTVPIPTPTATATSSGAVQPQCRATSRSALSIGAPSPSPARLVTSMLTSSGSSNGAGKLIGSMGVDTGVRFHLHDAQPSPLPIYGTSGSDSACAFPYPSSSPPSESDGAGYANSDSSNNISNTTHSSAILTSLGVSTASNFVNNGTGSQTTQGGHSAALTGRQISSARKHFIATQLSAAAAAVASAVDSSSAAANGVIHHHSFGRSDSYAPMPVHVAPGAGSSTHASASASGSHDREHELAAGTHGGSATDG